MAQSERSKGFGLQKSQFKCKTACETGVSLCSGSPVGLRDSPIIFVVIQDFSHSPTSQMAIYRTHLTSFHDRPSFAIGCHHGRSAAATGDRLPPRAIGCRHERSAATTSDRLPPRAIWLKFTIGRELVVPNYQSDVKLPQKHYLGRCLTLLAQPKIFV
jgi:hypothetical protein